MSKPLLMPDLSLERAQAKRHNGGLIAGIDEAGRGPWCGPVVAAAVILPENHTIEGLNDSKKLTALQRETLFDLITEQADFGVGIIEIDVIDEINILQATFRAMEQAFAGLKQQAACALIDGTQRPQLSCAMETVVKGDSRSMSIAAASIIAKVTRDRIMIKLAADYPDYGWETNKGYGTKQHRTALAQFGVTEHHRRSYKPIRLLLENAKQS